MRSHSKSDTRSNHFLPHCESTLFDPQDQDEAPLGSAQLSGGEGNGSNVPDIFSSMLKDTTSEHRTHLFDLNCKICTGKFNKRRRRWL